MDASSDELRRLLQRTCEQERLAALQAQQAEKERLQREKQARKLAVELEKERLKAAKATSKSGRKTANHAEFHGVAELLALARVEGGASGAPVDTEHTGAGVAAPLLTGAEQRDDRSVIRAAVAAAKPQRRLALWRRALVPGQSELSAASAAPVSDSIGGLAGEHVKET